MPNRDKFLKYARMVRWAVRVVFGWNLWRKNFVERKKIYNFPKAFRHAVGSKLSVELQFKSYGQK